MNTDKILPVNREHLLLMQVLCWLAPGINILKVGVKSAIEIVNTHPERVWWLSLIAVFVLVSFLLMFRGFVSRYTNRILSFPERKKSLFAFFDLKGYCIIIFMMCLGISLKFIPGIPVDFFACFYLGLGTALTVSGIRFFVSWCKAMAVRR
ncbi:MAG: hypothetical protein IJ776_08425 [Paludibacteraceae bacterium]|nr:hypothetical protein [Paludibacteraceae bacterium]